ncbi:MAG: TraR/DksA C4-type zinc finger protein [Acidimicrobiales bacterium]
MKAPPAKAKTPGAAAATKKAAGTKAAARTLKAPQAPKAKAAKSPAPARTAEAAVSPRTSGGLGAKAPAAKRPAEGYAKDERFLASQRAALLRERATYLEQAASLKAEAEALVEEMEPGDIQFDDESGEGGTVTVDRERDLALSAQALGAVEEIDHALAKLDNGTYGICENCGKTIVKARLEALPYARLCIDCKSGGLSKR